MSLSGLSLLLKLIGYDGTPLKSGEGRGGERGLWMPRPKIEKPPPGLFKNSAKKNCERGRPGRVRWVWRPSTLPTKLQAGWRGAHGPCNETCESARWNREVGRKRGAGGRPESRGGEVYAEVVPSKKSKVRGPFGGVPEGVGGSHGKNQNVGGGGVPTVGG